MNPTTTIIRFNNKTRLFIIEHNTADGTKSITAAPRWVNNKQTAEQWVIDRMDDNTFPRTANIIFQ